MKINLLAAGALVAALAMPLGASAQQSQPPAAHGQAKTTPSGDRIQHRWAKRLGGLNLSGDQQQHVQSLISQYSQAHPEGSPRDPGASRELRRQIMSLLTSDQQSQYHAQMKQHRAEMQQRHGQGGRQGQPDQQGQYEGQGQPGPYQQQQYGDPRNQQQPNGPPDQGPPGQGPPGQAPPA